MISTERWSLWNIIREYNQKNLKNVHCVKDWISDPFSLTLSSCHCRGGIELVTPHPHTLPGPSSVCCYSLLSPKLYIGITWTGLIRTLCDQAGYQHVRRRVGPIVLVFGDSDLVSLIGRLADLHSGKWFLILMISKVWAQRGRFLLSKGVLLGPPIPSTLCRFSLPYSQHVSMSRRVIGLRSSLLLSCCHPWCIRSDSWWIIELFRFLQIW